jgi:hypothetical protein
MNSDEPTSTSKPSKIKVMSTLPDLFYLVPRKMLMEDAIASQSEREMDLAEARMQSAMSSIPDRDTIESACEMCDDMTKRKNAYLYQLRRNALHIDNPEKTSAFFTNKQSMTSSVKCHVITDFSKQYVCTSCIDVLEHTIDSTEALMAADNHKAIIEMVQSVIPTDIAKLIEQYAQYI